jgi:hypothetical protein
MRVVVLLAFALAAACGLSVTGQEPAAVTPTDGGSTSSSSGTSTSSSSGSSEAGVEAGPPISCADVLNDPTLRHCLDFDEGVQDNYGFDTLGFDGPLKPSLSLEDSPLGERGKKAFALNFFGTASTGQKRDLAALLAFPEFGTGRYTQVSLDVDVTVDRLDDYAAIAGLHFAGSSCNQYGGVAVNKSRQLIHWEYPGPGTSVLGTYELGKPFHVHVEAAPGGAGGQPFSVSIDGGTPDPYSTALPYPGCNTGAGFVGNFFASEGANDSFHFRFDQLVMRAKF